MVVRRKVDARRVIGAEDDRCAGHRVVDVRKADVVETRVDAGMRRLALVLLLLVGGLVEMNGCDGPAELARRTAVLPRQTVRCTRLTGVLQ